MKTISTRIFFFPILIFICSCNNVDTSAQEEATEAVEFEAEGSSEKEFTETEYELVTYKYKEFIPSKFEENQINPNSNDYFNHIEQFAYSDEALSKSSFSIQKGEKIKILRIVKPNENPEKLIGNVVEIENASGKKGFITDLYLLPIPAPSSEDYGLVDYGKRFLHITDSASFEGEEYSDESGEYVEMQWEDNVYPFENNIVISESNYYEGGSEIGEFSFLSLQESLIFLDELAGEYDLLGSINYDMSPRNEEFESSFGPSTFSIKANNLGEIESIEFFMGDGCGEWFNLFKTENGYKIEIGGGC